MEPPRPLLGPIDVLVAEDDDELREVLVAVLESFELRVRAVAHGAKLEGELTTRAWRTETVHVVLSDIRMPGLSGLEVLARRRGVLAPAFVLMSGFVDAAVEEKARQLGAAGVFSKPLDLAHLRRVVSDLVAAHTALLSAVGGARPP